MEACSDVIYIYIDKGTRVNGVQGYGDGTPNFISRDMNKP
jgi:hypothetical protein